MYVGVIVAIADPHIDSQQIIAATVLTVAFATILTWHLIWISMSYAVRENGISVRNETNGGISVVEIAIILVVLIWYFPIGTW